MRYLIGALLGIVAYAVAERRNINRLRIQERIIQQQITAQEVQLDLIDEIYRMRGNLPSAPDCDDDRLGPFEDWLNRREGE